MDTDLPDLDEINQWLFSNDLSFIDELEENSRVLRSEYLDTLQNIKMAPEEKGSIFILILKDLYDKLYGLGVPLSKQYMTNVITKTMPVRYKKYIFLANDERPFWDFHIMIAKEEERVIRERRKPTAPRTVKRKLTDSTSSSASLTSERKKGKNVLTPANLEKIGAEAGRASAVPLVSTRRVLDATCCRICKQPGHLERHCQIVWEEDAVRT